jgi:hypothetical protein
MSNTLGNRKYFVYTDDTGEQYNILTDEDLGIAGGLTVATAGNPTLPRRFKPRGVYVEAVVEGENVRKFLVCSDTSPAYASNISTNVTIDGTVFQTTGRRGEKASFPRFDAPTP